MWRGHIYMGGLDREKELGSNKILKYSQELELVDSWGGPGTGDGQFNLPRSIVQDSRGNYYVSDELNHRIQKVSENGEFIASYGSYGSQEGYFAVQQGLSIDAQDRVYVADTYNNRIQVFETYPSWEYVDSFGTFLGSVGGIGGPYGYGTALNYSLYPKQAAVDEYSTLYVADFGNGRVAKNML